MGKYVESQPPVNLAWFLKEGVVARRRPSGGGEARGFPTPLPQTAGSLHPKFLSRQDFERTKQDRSSAAPALFGWPLRSRQPRFGWQDDLAGDRVAGLHGRGCVARLQLLGCLLPC